MNREQIYAAFFDKLAEIRNSRQAGDERLFKTVSRRLKHWDDTPASECPAVFVNQVGESSEGPWGGPKAWRLRLDLHIYARTTNAKDTPSAVLNELNDAIEAAFKPNLNGIVDLGLKGVVHRVDIQSVETLEGVLGELAVSVIAVEILTT